MLLQSLSLSSGEEKSSTYHTNWVMNLCWVGLKHLQLTKRIAVKSKLFWRMWCRTPGYKLRFSKIEKINLKQRITKHFSKHYLITSFFSLGVYFKNWNSGYSNICICIHICIILYNQILICKMASSATDGELIHFNFFKDNI